MAFVNNIVDPLSPPVRAALNSAGALLPLKSLRYGHLEELFKLARVDYLLPQQAVFDTEQGQADSIYLLSGTALVIDADGFEKNVGEQPLLEPLGHHQHNLQRVVAQTDVCVLRLPNEALQQHLARSQLTDYMLSEPDLLQSFDGDVELISTILSSNLFYKVPPINANCIIGKLQLKKVAAGERVIQQGDEGGGCYFIKSGEAQVLRSSEDAKAEQVVASISAGRCFGEDALIDKRPRNASVQFISEGELFYLDKQAFLSLFERVEAPEVAWPASQTDALKYVLVDVRSDAEYSLGHLPKAANLPLSVMAMKKRLLNKQQAYLFYCESGVRSGAAAHFLSQQGYNVAALQGGLRHQTDIPSLQAGSCYVLREGRAVETD
ncbi:cyclic nucleotide-binding domain-containing protein [Agaribacterium sp. ZY112]|uniref:cyclic nucleotide-binding domain-containing protein n=1 Tax=Agaribacterium sp. ZY112 TaxID=3233574 RepID=UPI003523B081